MKYLVKQIVSVQLVVMVKVKEKLCLEAKQLFGRLRNSVVDNMCKEVVVSMCKVMYEVLKNSVVVSMCKVMYEVLKIQVVPKKLALLKGWPALEVKQQRAPRTT